MNANRNLKIDFRITKYRRNKIGIIVKEKVQHDHFIQKESKGKFKRTPHHFKATHKKYVYKKKGIGGYDR